MAVGEVLFICLEFIGTVSFAVSGAMAALEKRVDLFGVIFLGITTALAGGILRDVIIGRVPPSAFADSRYMIVAGVTSAVVFLAALLAKDYYKNNVDTVNAVNNVFDAAQTLEDAADYSFGAQSISGSDKVEQAISEASEDIGQDLSYDYYEDPYGLVKDLYDGDIDAIIYNTAYNSSLTEHYPTFEQDIRELKQIEIKTKVDKVSGDNKNVTKDAFTVFVSGIDTEGSIDTTSRSDVNMLVTVNPKTKQVLMTSIPRDYYVQLPGVSGESYDKLTHAGLYGAQCSMDTLSQLFGVDVDYYAKVNFTTLRDMVNALGGVDLDSRYEFTTISGEYFVQGMNYDVDGSSALAFARERYNLPNGDNDRVLNQQIVMKAILNKCMSPAILTGYMGIMESLSDSFETSLSQQQISSLVRMQLDSGAGWDILSSAVVGSGSESTCYSSGDNMLYVMIPDENSVQTAAGFMNQIKSGEVISQEEISGALAN